MQKILQILILTITLTYAGPAFQEIQTFHNADNSTFQGALHGDPWFHYIQDTAGNIIVKNGSGSYAYADYDSSGSLPKLTASGIQAGTLSALRSANPTPTQLTAAWSAARSTIAAQTLHATLSSTVWYEVRDYGNGEKTLYQVSVNSTVTTLTYQKIENGAVSTIKKDNSVHIDGPKLIQDNVSHLYYSLFSPQTGYIEVKVYQEQAAGASVVLSYTDRWYSNQTDATSYYNTL